MPSAQQCALSVDLYLGSSWHPGPVSYTHLDVYKRQCADSQSVKTTQIPGERGFDAGKQINGRKRHILVDTMGLLLAVVVTAASVSDPAGARRLFTRLGGACKKLRRIWVDGTYRGSLVDWVSDHCGVILQAVLRTDGTKGFRVLPRRWVVERTFAWLTQCRRLSKDYEGKTTSSEAMIYAVSYTHLYRPYAGRKARI